MHSICEENAIKVIYVLYLVVRMSGKNKAREVIDKWSELLDEENQDEDCKNSQEDLKNAALEYISSLPDYQPIA